MVPAQSISNPLTGRNVDFLTRSYMKKPGKTKVNDSKANEATDYLSIIQFDPFILSVRGRI